MTKLVVRVDGALMPEEEGRAFWARFSEHMEKNKGDLAGFARAEGFASVRPALGPDGPELLVSRTAAQQPYARAGSSAGSPATQGHAPRGHKNPRKKHRR